MEQSKQVMQLKTSNYNHPDSGGLPFTKILWEVLYGKISYCKAK